MSRVLCTPLVVLPLVGCAAPPDAYQVATPSTYRALREANAVILDRAGATVGDAGVVTEKLGPLGDGVIIRVRASKTALEPGLYGFNIHEAGTCTPPDFASAGPHLRERGSSNPYILTNVGGVLGQLPNVVVQPDRTIDEKFSVACGVIRAARDGLRQSYNWFLSPVTEDEEWQTVSGALGTYKIVVPGYLQLSKYDPGHPLYNTQSDTLDSGQLSTYLTYERTPVGAKLVVGDDDGPGLNRQEGTFAVAGRQAPWSSSGPNGSVRPRYHFAAYVPHGPARLDRQARHEDPPEEWGLLINIVCDSREICSDGPRIVQSSRSSLDQASCTTGEPSSRSASKRSAPEGPAGWRRWLVLQTSRP